MLACAVAFGIVLGFRGEGSMVIVQSAHGSPDRAAEDRLDQRLAEAFEHYDPKTQKTLHEVVGLIEAAGNERDETCILLLVKHIDFARFGAAERGFTPDLQWYPAAAALVKIEVAAIPALVEAVLHAPTDENGGVDKDDIVRAKLAMKMIAKIYDRGGFGAEMTQRRLELSASELDEKARQRVEKLFGLKFQKR